MQILFSNFLDTLKLVRGIHWWLLDSPHKGPIMRIHWWLLDSPHKGPVMQKTFPCHVDADILSVLVDSCDTSITMWLGDNGLIQAGKLKFLYPHFNEVERGYTGFTLSVCPSVDRIVSALYLQQYSLDPFHICTSYQATSEDVLRVMLVTKF